MKRKIILYSFVLLLALALVMTVHATNLGGTNNDGKGSSVKNSARIILSLGSKNVVVGGTVTVNVQVKNAPVIYGSDVHLVFDPQMLEVVDADQSQAGVQNVPGDFIDSKKSFIVQNNINNQAGTIDYALALLNPAPPVKGNGELLQVMFLAKAPGNTTVSISEGMFGTQSGETISPDLSSAEIAITSKGN